MIIFGFRVRRKTLDEGRFHCPEEGGDRAYERVQLRRWFTLFFIPLIPLKVLGETIHCPSCGSDWDPSVLQRPTTEQLRGRLADLVTATASALVANGSPSAGRLDRATDFVRGAGGDPGTRRGIE